MHESIDATLSNSICQQFNKMKSIILTRKISLWIITVPIKSINFAHTFRKLKVIEICYKCNRTMCNINMNTHRLLRKKQIRNLLGENNTLSCCFYDVVASLVHFTELQGYKWLPLPMVTMIKHLKAKSKR